MCETFFKQYIMRSTDRYLQLLAVVDKINLKDVNIHIKIYIF